jgi:biopolymer transport protein ExbD
MSFKEKKRPKERVELISFFDMFFILFVFFLVTSFAARMPMKEHTLFIPTPENTMGRAQILVQFIDETNVFWLDESVSSLVTEIEENYGYLSSTRLRDRILEVLFNQNVFTLPELDAKLSELKLRANQNPDAEFFLLIRCPNEIPYYRVLDIITNISETTFPNIEYGCIGGTFSEIRQCRRIYTVMEIDEEGNRRKNICIDF